MTENGHWSCLSDGRGKEGEEVQIRAAKREDVPYFLEIYNYEVEHGTATFDLNPRTLSDRMEWYEEHTKGNHLLLAAQIDGRAVGYASLSAYREKEAYAKTVELSVYVDPKYRRRGAARALMAAILAQAREREDIHTVVSVITGGNQASIALHQEFGFVFCGRIRQVGEKFGLMLDIENYQLMTENRGL